MTGVAAPEIQPLDEAAAPRPFWSVMVPAYNPSPAFLEQTLRSVLDQDPGEPEMQIEVVDDGSPGVDVASLVKRFAGGRVAVFRSPVNRGLAGCWNACLARSRGQWVHVLHQDDLVLPGFYRVLRETAEMHPDLSLIAARSFYIDAEGAILGVTPRLPALEKGGREVDAFFYKTPIQCPGVAVKRSFYENAGGFRPDLSFTLDCEMWTRVIGLSGGLVKPDVLSCYRKSGGNETMRLTRNAEQLHDFSRLHQLFAARYRAFDKEKAQRRVCELALKHANHFLALQDYEAAAANLRYWKTHAPVTLRLRRMIAKFLKGIFP